MREDRSVTELLTANYTFLNERLAKHYGIPNIYGDHFRRVTFTDGSAEGCSARPACLTVTSYPNRTSVTIRGRWLLANLLGAPPPAAAARCAGAEGRRASTVRRGRCASAWRCTGKNPACASCHQRMDPLGFALENFDAARQMAHRQRWRAGGRVGARCPDGTRFDGVAGLRDAAGEPQGRFRPHVHREAAWRMRWAAAWSIGPAGGPQDRPRRGARTATAGRRSSRDRQQPAVPHGLWSRAATGELANARRGNRNEAENEEPGHDHCLKKAIPRRTILRGIGRHARRCRCSTAWCRRSRRCSHGRRSRSTGSASSTCPTA